MRHSSTWRVFVFRMKGLHYSRLVLTVSTEAAIKRRYAYFIGGVTLSLIFCYLLITMCIRTSTFPDVVGWEQNRSRAARDYIHPNWNTTLVDSHKACSAAYPPSIIVIVSSSTNHFAFRMAIRKTWADSIEEKFNIAVVFFVGRPTREEVYPNLIAESNQFGDIVIEDFIDTYNNLTLKSLMMLKWVKNNCKDTRHVLRSDDDVYINVRNLAVFVDSIARSGRKDILSGDLSCSGPVFRETADKWYVPRYMYEKEVYPDYLNGYCYLMSTEIALRMYEEAFSLPMFHIDDVFLTGFCAERMGVVPTGHHLFKGFRRGKELKECTIQDVENIVHSCDISVDYMYAVHAFISRCTNSLNWRPTSNYTAVISDSEFSTCATGASPG